jgi:predicted SprT family Zn-dependent metalloprotease
MEKEDFINKIRTVLSSEYKIDIKKSGNSLIHIKNKLFSKNILIHPIYLKADNNIFNDIIFFIKNSNKKNQELSNVKKRLSIFYQNNLISKKEIKLNHLYNHKNITLFFMEILDKISLIFDLDFSILKISWGRKSKKRCRSIRFGSYNMKNHLIKIHPVLDDPAVPDHFIKSVIYHEICHYIYNELNPEMKSYHNKIFYNILKKVDMLYSQSKKWENENKKIFFTKGFLRN